MRYRVVKRAALRSGFERDSEGCGCLKPGEVVRVSERRALEDGSLRLHYAWVRNTGRGSLYSEHHHRS